VTDEEPTYLPLTSFGAAASAGDRIAHYHILQKVGEGGMGEVYLAEQRRPVRRQVALKLIKWGMDSKAVVARFESERQALALMNHPNIARVFDAGATEQGRPYFAMEYVKGLPILEYCDTQRVPLVERLELFLQICDGVQHAHQKGVIHRDLKPSNVLVTIQDGKPVPKIIDFGVAKATEHRLTDQSVFTEMGQLVGTLEYMSPEQAEMTGLDIDTRSDIYSLGVVLYELLTGALPFASDTLRAAGLFEIRRRIREDEPPLPSVKLANLGPGAEAVAKQRRTDATTLGRQIHGDLDWITAKALEKDRVRRYASASELQEDIRRHLRNEPVHASPPSTAYRVGKFVKRHRAGVYAATLVVLAMIAGTALALASRVQALRAERLAREAERVAIAEAETATRVSTFLEELFRVSDPSAARERPVTARELLDKGATKIQNELQGQPVVQARMMGTMGRVYHSLGLYEQAEPLLESAVRIRREVHGNDHADVAESLDDLGWLRQSQGRYEEAVGLHQHALHVREAVFGPTHEETARSVYRLATAHARKGDYDRARPLYRRAIAIFENDSPDERFLSWCLQDLAITHTYSGELAEARPLFERALALKERIFGPDHADVARTLTGLGYNLVLTGEYATARALLDRARSINERTLGPDHPDSANTVHSMGELLRATGDLPRAREVLTRALELQERTLEPENLDVAITLHSLAAVHEELGELVRADELYRRALNIRERILPPSHRHLVQALESRARVLERIGRGEEAGLLRSRAGHTSRTPASAVSVREARHEL
jgi:serine/threonine protein kinase/Tfp pilus assembly protein PilF